MLDRAFRIDSEGRSDVGRVRDLNEDSYLMRPDIGVWVVADGMGGHDAGDFASQTLVAELNRLAAPQSAPALLSDMERRVLEANETLRQAAASRGEDTVIGCTMASLVIYKGAYACVWSGDSRIYRVRAGRIEQLSRDHTEAQDLVDRGMLTPDEAKRWPRKNVITRAIGVFDAPELEMVQGRLEDGDLFVICSDGLTEHVADDEILGASGRRPLARVCDELIELTLQRGAKDNVTVIAVSCREATQMQQGGDWADWGQG